MKIAKFFAELGFDVDTTGFDTFSSKLRDVRASTALFARNLKALSNRLSETKERVDKLSGRLDLTSQKKSSTGVAEAYDKMADSIIAATRYLEDFTKKADYAKPKVYDLTTQVWKGKNAWEAYAKAVKESRDAIRSVNDHLNTLRQSPPKITVTNKIYPDSTTSGFSAFHRPSQPQQDDGGMGMPLILGDIRQFFRSMTPTGVVAGGALGAGYITKEIVQAGREGQKMERILLGASANTETFAHNLDYVRKTSKDLALSTNDFGSAYAKVLQATELSPLTLKQTEDMMTGFARMMTATGMVGYDQAGVLKQLGQMFSTGRIQQDELNSIADRGLNLAKYLRLAAKELGIKDYQKLQEAGKADPVKLMPVAARLMAEAANKNNALNKALETSQAKQQLFMNEVKDTAKILLESGVDKFLAELFSIMTDILKVMKEFGSGLYKILKGLRDAGKGIASFIEDNKTLGLVLAGVLAGILAITVAKRKDTTVTGLWGSAWETVIKNKAKILRGAGILGMLYAIYQFGIDYTAYLNGETNWITTMGSHIELLISKVDLLFARLKGFKMDVFGLDNEKNSNISFTPKLGATEIALDLARVVNKAVNQEYQPDFTPFGIAANTMRFFASPIKIEITSDDLANGKTVEAPLNLGAVGQ